MSIRPLGAFDFAAFHLGSQSAPRSVPVAGQKLQKASLENLSDLLRDLRRTLEHLEQRSVVRGRRASEAAAGVATSATTLGLTSSFTTLSATAEVNETPTSFTPFGPVVSGNTTSLPTISGIYDGSGGDDTLTFEFRRDAAVGSSDQLRVRVTRGDGSILANLNFRLLPAGTPVALPNGLSLSLGPGDVERNDTFTVQVSASVGSVVDPTKPFDGVRNENPNFDPGVSVGAGTFEVNGVSIAVAADDSVNDVLAKITASAADVNANYDAATDSVTLAAKVPGAIPTIVVANDTSGFLAATKLSGATAVQGLETASYTSLISDVPELSSVTTGDFFVNGVAIQVDPAADSVSDIVDRINQSAANVTASYDPVTERVQIAANDVSGSVVLAAGSSGLLPALGLAEGTHAATAARRGREGFDRPDEVAKELGELKRSLNQIFGGRFARIRDDDTESLRALLATALTEVFEDRVGASGSSLRTRFGFAALFSRGSSVPVVELSRGRFQRELSDDFESIRDFLFGPDRSGSRTKLAGLVPVLLDAVTNVQTEVSDRLGRNGRLGQRVDLSV